MSYYSLTVPSIMSRWKRKVWEEKVYTHDYKFIVHSRVDLCLKNVSNWMFMNQRVWSVLTAFLFQRICDWSSVQNKGLLKINCSNFLWYSPYKLTVLLVEFSSKYSIMFKSKQKTSSLLTLQCPCCCLVSRSCQTSLRPHKL